MFISHFSFSSLKKRTLNVYSFPQLMNGCTMVGLNCNRNIFRNGLPHLYRMLFYYHGQSTKAGTGIQAIYVVSGAFESGKFSSTAFPSAPLPSTPTHPTAPSPCPNSYRCPRPHHYVSRPLYCADIEYVWVCVCVVRACACGVRFHIFCTGGRKFQLVHEDDLDSAKAGFATMRCEHIYSLQKGKHADPGAALHQADAHLNRVNVYQSSKCTELSHRHFTRGPDPGNSTGPPGNGGPMYHPLVFLSVR